MLRKVSELVGGPVAATDGEIGQVEAIHFDDEQWTVRHIVLKAGGELSGRKILLPPDAMRRGAPGAALGVALTRYEVMRSPGVDSEQAVSEQYQEASAAYYSDEGDVNDLKAAERSARRSPLRSSKEVIGYSVHDADGLVGHVADLVFDDDSWRLMALLVDAREWRPGETLRLAPDAVRAIDWKTREVRLHARRDQLQQQR